VEVYKEVGIKIKDSLNIISCSCSSLNYTNIRKPVPSHKAFLLGKNNNAVHTDFDFSRSATNTS